MTNFDKMEQNFVALTEEELMDVDGGIAWEVVSFFSSIYIYFYMFNVYPLSHLNSQVG